MKARGLARVELYFAYALDLARNGLLEAARDVALETAGHVTLGHPNAHLLLGQVAVGLRDRTLLREAKAFLQSFSYRAWEMKLDRVVQSGLTDFTGLT
jgi:hypothetical protein